MTEKLQKLADANIQLLPLVEISTHFVFERDGFVALVERVKNEFGRIGTAGILTGSGPAPLIWRNGAHYFKSKGFEQLATEQQVSQLRAFQSDLESALA